MITGGTPMTQETSLCVSCRIPSLKLDCLDCPCLKIQAIATLAKQIGRQLRTANRRAVEYFADTSDGNQVKMPVSQYFTGCGDIRTQGWYTNSVELESEVNEWRNYLVWGKGCTKTLVGFCGTCDIH